MQKTISETVSLIRGQKGIATVSSLMQGHRQQQTLLYFAADEELFVVFSV